jgi:Flp pilus assembly protein TadB
VNADQIDRHRENTAAAVLAALVGLGGLGALVNATGHPLAVGLAVTALGVVVLALRWVARMVRERREDQADALAGAAWRARHLPQHPQHPSAALPGRRGERAGVA